uniref:Uncharacterized protein n=1 Tax=Periophthalmus magnuspinnatus TaxID=409849 RepID=A0A3B4B9X2_9GOBI
MSVSQDGGSSSDELPISPCSSSAGSHSGFYSFVEDPFSSEAEQNEAWMVSPQRQSHLATLRQENAYKLQAYSSHKKPGSLFQDDTDSQYDITPRYGYKVVGEQEERQLRREIIRGQAPKKTPVAEKELDSLTSDTNRLIEGFSISFSHVTPKPRPTVDSDAINKEQINFDDARKQFVQMEQNKLDPIIRPRKIEVKTSPKLKQDVTVVDREVRKEELMFKPNVEDFKAEEKDQSTSHTHNPIQMVNNTFQFNVEPETPIEREIRIAQEREENLRRSRGLQSSVSEMVEIKTKRLQLQVPLTPSRTKDKGRASFIFQEIQRKEEAIKQDSTTQELAGPRLVRAHSYDILQSNAIEGDVGQSNQEYAVTKAFETLNENMGQEAKLDVVDYALQKQNYTTHDGSKTDNGQSYTKQIQEYVEPYVPGAKRVEGYSYAKQNDQVLARNQEFEGFKSFKERWQNQNGDKMENGFKGDSIERSRVDFFSDDVLLLSCYPHKHPENSAPSKQEQKQDSPRARSPQTSMWRDRLEQTGLHTRGQAAQFIERDIEEALRREQELREQREAQVRQVYSPQTLVQQADKMATTQFYPQIKTGEAIFVIHC